MKRKYKKRALKTPDEDAAILRTIISALMEGRGHGGLSWMARKLDLTPSNLKKRMASASGAFDAPTLRAALLVLAMKADKHETEILNTVEVGELAIHNRMVDDEISPTWEPKV